MAIAEEFTHFDEQGNARMVNVGGKAETKRIAVAAGRVLVNKKTFDLIRSGGVKKGDVLVILEAMKMENEIMAPRDAKVAQVLAAKGAAVNTGDALVVLE